MEKEYVKRLIYEYNPQLTGKTTEIPAFKRKMYFELLKWLPKKQILAITGLRRVGKTTLMKQLIQKLDKVAFFSFDEEETQTKDVLVFVIDFFLKNLKAKHIFLDEIHYVKDWQGVLKRYYDTQNVKFVISGSEALEIAKARESLAGRIITFKLETLSFKEYLELKGVKIRGNSTEEIYELMLPEKELLEHEFFNYLYGGAFPEIVNETSEEIIKKYITELVAKKIIYRDIPRIFEIKRKDLLFALFRYVCDNSANLFEIKNLCKTFNADYETVTNYLFYLQKSFLVKVSEVYSKSMAKRVRRSKKIYVVHPSVAFAVLCYKKEMVIEKIMGQYVESLFGSEFFWRDKHKNEVDVVIKGKPFEVKYKSYIAKEDLKGLLRFMEVFGSKDGTVITKDIFKEDIIDGKAILFIPAWLFSLRE